MIIITTLLILIILISSLNAFAFFNPQRKVEKVLKEEFKNKIEIVKYKKQYYWDRIRSKGFSVVYLHDKEKDINYFISHDYKKNKDILKKDSFKSLVEKINEAEAEALTFINKLTNKAQAFEKVSNRDFFVNYYHTYKEYQIILFLDMNEFSFEKTKKIFNELELYLSQNQADKIIFIPKKYKKYFSQEIRKSYFGYFEKNKIFKENGIQDLEVLNSGMFGSFLPHLSSYRISYIDQKDMHEDVGRYHGSKIQEVRGEFSKKHYLYLLNKGSNLDISLGLKTEELIKRLYQKKYNKNLDIDFIDSFLIWDQNRFEVEIYDSIINQKEELKIRFLKYDFLNDQFIEHQQ
ncbi:hypothetical protein [Halanaerobium praevalens]|uniref:Uncharacterized protein n=1 Tax=Halanaerobium praevalens (strain ATCC 33744 / DSM 2228 / GSL) TaxID=572479 RepID=E3DLF4_HALPG|nr:hypothetical protein [Halanaerobium praevalens]ADO77193.1 hypothetical protein Hprae_1040 [Halanaerobium praevalens DSM 2228]